MLMLPVCKVRDSEKTNVVFFHLKFSLALFNPAFDSARIKNMMVFPENHVLYIINLVCENQAN